LPAVAAAAIGFVAPVASSANAQEAKVVIRSESGINTETVITGGARALRASYYRDRDRVVIIKRRHHDRDTTKVR
jgi:hypothetical protein